MQRYPYGPQSFFRAPSVTVVWYGEKVFFANRHFQAAWKDDDHLGEQPIPDYEKWVATLGDPVCFAYNEATGLRFALWVTQNPYRFAVEAQSDLWIPGDTIVHNVFGLDRWLVSKGVHPGDVASSPSGSLWYRFTVNWMLNPVLSKLSFISLNLKEYKGWRSWGGEWPQKP